jgi:hypothetical protein
VLGKLPALGQSAHEIGEAKHLVEIGLEPVPAHAGALPSLSFEKALQVDAADGSGGGIEASAHSIFSRTSSAQSCGNVESFRLAVDQHRDLILRVEAFAVGAMTVGLPQERLRSTKEPGSISRREPRLRMSSAAQIQVGFSGVFI